MLFEEELDDFEGLDFEGLDFEDELDEVGGFGELEEDFGYAEALFEDDDELDEYGDGEVFEGELLEAGADYESDEIEEMEALAEMAAEAGSDAEADAFIGALIPLAAKILPKAISIGRRVLPKLIRGGVRLARRFRRSRAGRQLIRTVPRIMRGTARDLLRRTAAGRPVSSGVAARSLARHTARMLGSRRRVRRCIHQSRRRARRARLREAA